MNPDPAKLYLQQFVDTGKNPAISAAVYAEGHVQFISVGLANAARAIPANEHTIYRIGSVTKAFTGTVIQELVLRHTLSTQGTVDQYLGAPIATTSFRQPTIQELLDMRGGVPHGWYYSQSASLTPGAIDERYSAITSAPGSAFDYSNFSYGLLADAAAHRLHLSYDELFAHYLFSPLSMSDSSILGPNSSDVRLAVPYGGKMLPEPAQYLYPAGAAGGFTSAADLMSFALFNIGEKTPRQPLDAAVARRVHGATTFYSNGWGQVRLKDGSSLWIADGESIGGCATVFALPVQKIAIAVLTNVCHSNQTDDIAAHLLSMRDANLGNQAAALFQGGGSSAASPTQRPAASGKFAGYVLINKGKYALHFELKPGGAAVCAIADFPAVASKSDLEDDGTRTFDCGGPNELNKLGGNVAEIGRRPVHWTTLVRIVGSKAYGGARVQNSDDSPGFRLNFPLSAEEVPSF